MLQPAPKGTGCIEVSYES